MNRRFAHLALVSVFAALAGCSTPSYSPLSSPAPATPVLAAPAPAPTPTPAPVRASAPAPAPQPPPEVIVLPHEAAPVIGLDNVEMETESPATGSMAVPAAPQSISFGSSWVPLRLWIDRCGLGAAARSVAGGTTIYRVSTRNGACQLTMGSRLAHWNGTPVWLGFAPRMVQGEPHIHGLDAEKTLQPLSRFAGPLKARTRTVVLDPGHGGSDSGTRGGRNELEKNFALDWALRTERLLTNAGWNVILTRRTDVDVSLAERVAVADRVRADLFISLHFNSTFPQTQPSGVETYCLTPTGMPSTLARGYTDDERAVFPNNAFDVANLDWAFRIHNSIIAQTHAQDDGIKRARFMSVLRYQNRPAVLLEGGFLSNQNDASQISASSYRELLARAIVDALK